MSAAHTEGRLNYMVKGGDFAAGGVRYCRLVVEPAFGVTKITEVATSVLEPNARRLAACWNAFVGTSTEAIEANVPRAEIASLIAERDALNKELAAAHALLTELMTDVPDSAHDHLTDRIRAFLKGGAA